MFREMTMPSTGERIRVYCRLVLAICRAARACSTWALLTFTWALADW